MPFEAEKIDDETIAKYESLRTEGQKQLAECINGKINNRPVLEQVALLADTGLLESFYLAVGKARLSGHSWKHISAAAKSARTYKDSQHFQRMYLSYCRNNNIEPVRIRQPKEN